MRTRVSGTASRLLSRLSLQSGLPFLGHVQQKLFLLNMAAFVASQSALAAITSTSTTNSSRVKPPTIISVEAGGGVAVNSSRVFM